MRICFDLDDTLCTGKPYDEAEPFPGVVEYLHSLRSAGHTIIIHTARGMGTANGNPGRALANIGLLTMKQLEAWGVPYDELVLGKPSYDILVDDKSINSVQRLRELMELSHGGGNHKDSGQSDYSLQTGPA